MFQDSEQEQSEGAGEAAGQRVAVGDLWTLPVLSPSSLGHRVSSTCLSTPLGQTHGAVSVPQPSQGPWDLLESKRV